MAEKVDIFMPLYLADYLADTTDLTAEEHGAYLLLLMGLWRNDGRLENNPNRLARAARVPSDHWPLVWESIERFFDVADGFISQGRLTSELEKARTRKAVAAENGRRGVAAKRSLAEATLKPPLSHPQANGVANGQQNGSSSPSPSPSPSPSGSEEDTDSSEPASPASEPAVLVFPTVGKRRTWDLTARQLAEWAPLFPGIDVSRECSQAYAWTLANASKRKTFDGMPRFLVSWLGRAQNRAGSSGMANGATGPPVPRDVRVGHARAEDFRHKGGGRDHEF